MSHTRPDVLVLGGGPAGTAAARLLAIWGHRVVLRTKPRSGPPLAESIPPSTARLFDLLGVRDAVDAAGFVRATGNTVWWGNGTPRVEQFAGERLGWQVTTHGLEDVLRRAAIDAGVSVELARGDAADSATRQAPTAAPKAPAGVPAPAPEDAPDSVPPMLTLDCTGRAGVVARARGWRVYEQRLRTIALVGWWRAPRGWKLPDPTHTLVESYDGGWAWSVPRSATERCIAVMVDPKTSNLAHDASARHVYLREIGRTVQLAALLREASLVDRPVGWDASMYHATQYAAHNVLLVGDAGSFIDPLSSAGVKKALAAGWLAAVTVHTSLLRPSMQQVAFDFFAAREREVYASFRAMTGRFLAEAAAGHAHSFWDDRSDAGSDVADRQSTTAAFEHLRAQPALRVVRAGGLRIAASPAVSGNQIVLEDRVVSERHPAGIRYAFDVDLLGLLEIAPQHESVPAAFEAYNRRYAPVALPDFLAALSTAIAEKWLQWV